jgi:hypothetical protein
VGELFFAEEGRRRSWAMSRLLEEALDVPGVLFLVDGEGKILHGPASLRARGMDPDLIVGRSVSFTSSEGGTARFEIGGVPGHFPVRLREVRNPDGSLVGSLVLAGDAGGPDPEGGDGNGSPR